MLRAAQRMVPTSTHNERLERRSSAGGREAGKPLVIDLVEIDRGKPHWLHRDDGVLRDPDLATFGQKSIQFDGCRRMPIPGFDDPSVEMARTKMEAELGRRLKNDRKTRFPAFTLYRRERKGVGRGVTI